MTRLEQSSQEGTQRSEPTEWRPEQEIHPSGLEGREFQENPTNHLGFKDRPCREFRAQYDGEYIEPPTTPQRIEPFDDPRETVARVNPEYYPTRDGSYENNCADAARCFERTWRGNREEAAGRAETADADGNMAIRGESPSRIEEWAGERFTRTDDIAAVKARLQEGGHGTSAIVGCGWESDGDTGGHAFNVVNHQGRIEVVDPQTHEVLPFDDATIHPAFDHTYDHHVMMWDREGTRIF